MYSYIFYKLYKITKKTEHRGWSPNMRTPVTTSIFSLSILQFLNLLTILAFLVGLKIIELVTLTKSTAIILGAIILIINYLTFVYKKKYLMLEEKFDKDSKNVKLIKAILFWLYIILTFVLFIVVLETYKTVDR